MCLLMEALLYTFNWSKFSWALGSKRRWMSNASVNRYVWCTLKMFPLVITREIRRCKSVKAEAMHENMLVVIFLLINFWYERGTVFLVFLNKLKHGWCEFNARVPRQTLIPCEPLGCPVMQAWIRDEKAPPCQDPEISVPNHYRMPGKIYDIGVMMWGWAQVRYMVKRNLFCVINFPTVHPQHRQYLCSVILVNQVYVEERKSSLKEEFPQFQLARLN